MYLSLSLSLTDFIIYTSITKNAPKHTLPEHNLNELSHSRSQGQKLMVAMYKMVNPASLSISQTSHLEQPHVSTAYA